ncbi:hypothetical protein B9Z65_3961 [Elsinoe australis]|uniref:Uncharacterized protein n=1 Tax=Elsinoe australis TaxID=40998 RepID=A0A2P7Z1F5_9PEZI|nr:hypothetical protein B9Z65_3961 [Elsinoe australis]
MFRHAIEAIHNSIVDEELSEAQPVLIILRGLDGGNIQVQHWKSLIKEYHGIIDSHIAFYLDKQGDGGFTKALNLSKLVDQKATKSEDEQLVLGRYHRLDEKQEKSLSDSPIEIHIEKAPGAATIKATKSSASLLPYSLTKVLDHLP